MITFLFTLFLLAFFSFLAFNIVLLARAVIERNRLIKRIIREYDSEHNR